MEESRVKVHMLMHPDPGGSGQKKWGLGRGVGFCYTEPTTDPSVQPAPAHTCLRCQNVGLSASLPVCPGAKPVLA